MNEDRDLTEVPFDELILLILEYMEAYGMLDELLERYREEE